MKVTDVTKGTGKKAGKFFDEFKAFAMRGNVIDMAVGVVIGGAFGKIVSSLVSDIIMPLVGLVSGGVDFTTLRWVIRPADEANGIAEASMNYGNFIQTAVDFIIIAFSIFLVIKLITGMKRKEEEAPAEPAAPAPKPDDVVLLEEIRDLLKEKK